MNTLLLEHFAAVSKIAAVRQSRERQQGVNCSDGGFMSAAAELKVVPCSIQCVFKPMVLTDSTQTVFAMSNSASAPRIDLHNGYITAYLGYPLVELKS